MPEQNDLWVLLHHKTVQRTGGAPLVYQIPAAGRGEIEGSNSQQVLDFMLKRGAEQYPTNCKASYDKLANYKAELAANRDNVLEFIALSAEQNGESKKPFNRQGGPAYENADPQTLMPGDAIKPYILADQVAQVRGGQKKYDRLELIADVHLKNGM